jgi:hypothetical protein
MKMRRLMVSVVHRDLDAFDDRERRHGLEAYDVSDSHRQNVAIRGVPRRVA